MELIEHYVSSFMHPDWLIEKGEPVFVLNNLEQGNTLRKFTYVGYTKDGDAIVIPRRERDRETNRLIVPHSNILTIFT